MNKYFPFFLVLLSFVQIANAQFLWLEDQTNTRKIEFTAEEDVPTNLTGNFLNPNTSGINTHTIVSKYNRPEGTNDFLHFNLFNYVTDLTDYTVTLKAYIDIPTDELTTNNSKLRVFFDSSDEGGRVYKQLNFTVGQEWETFTFHFQNVAIPQNVLDVGGYDLMTLGLANGSTVEPATTYYFDGIYGSTDQTATTVDHPAAWLAGSWGATFPVYGGERLDAEIATGHDPLGGVQELVTELPAVGHVITNLSYFAHSHYFNVRDNTNVDVATEIHESLVPSAENQEIMLEVLQTLKNSGKKIILYISTNYLDRASDETKVAWVAYYTANFGGNEYLAYKDLVQGFIPAIAAYADGYWFDTTTTLRDDGYLEDFVQMFKDADPGAAMSVSEFGHLHYIEGEPVTVDSDGVDDEDERDYDVSNFRGNNSYSDFTRGHVSALGGGAPPNSWGYEEFTLPAMVGNPWSMYEKKQVLKHAWFPIRDKWHVSSANLIFGIEDAYRFSKILIDAKAGVTFANTVSNINGIAGYMTPDEMVIMKAINDRLMSSPVPDYEPYVRPEGAFLVGEIDNVLSTDSIDPTSNTSQIQMYPNPVINELTITRTTNEINNIVVMSTIGIKVLEKLWDDGAFTTRLDLSNLNTGMYFVNLSNGTNRSITRRIIISK
ncbi:putative secreted protein (Por secretion system target) [Mariniflexile fucanivorans]|uniref:Putative secreted protein (Por secretion system target) n=1 Tax=Mariniflexile fucanivorans TaxID=264023 RepID=A0A4R1RNM7_9FLAO|nr:T9SS type A sorting domain-containing protein [Mariniflexile fucanivorans]TCL67452.1 putative secreted protein (Por secretion system target) [Mariniflexile fucanivorans]